MRTEIRAVLGCSIVFLLISSAAFAQTPGSQDGEQTYRIQGLQLRWAVANDSFNLPVGISGLVQDLLIQRPELIFEPLKQARPELGSVFVYSDRTRGTAGSTPHDLTVYLSQANLTSTDHQYIDILLKFEPVLPFKSEAKPGTAVRQKLARQIEENVAKAMPEFSREYVKKFLSKEIESVESNLQKAQSDADNAQRDLARSTGLPSEKAAEQLAEISRQQIATRLSAVGMEARERAIYDEIKRAEAKRTQTQADPALDGLKRLLSLRKETYNRVKELQNSGVAPRQELQSAEADVLSAEIEFNKALTAAQRASGGQRIDELNAELSRLAIDRAETQARSRFLDEASERATLDLRDRREAEKKEEAAKPALANAQVSLRDGSARLTQLKKEIEDIRPLRIEAPDDSPSDAAPRGGGQSRARESK